MRQPDEADSSTQTSRRRVSSSWLGRLIGLADEPFPIPSVHGSLSPNTPGHETKGRGLSNTLHPTIVFPIAISYTQRPCSLEVTMELLTERYGDKIWGTLSCFDRVVINGTIPEICHKGAMALYLNTRKIRFFDYPRWAKPFRDEIRQNAEQLARDHGLEIEFIRRQKEFRKEQRIKEIIAQRGNHPGLVHIFSAMEHCPSFEARYSKRKNRTILLYTEAKCIHYYFYFIDEELGLCYLRVPTWAPFRLQFYFNAHNYLAAQLTKRGIDFQLLDNAFVHIDDFATAQKLADALPVSKLHRRLNRFARLYCPAIRHFRSGYHWSIREIEYATDIVFQLKRLRVHGLIKKVRRTYKYHLTRLGRRVVLTALHMRQMITPAFAFRPL